MVVKDPEDHGATIDASQIDGESVHRPAPVAGRGEELIPGQTFAGRYEVESLVGRGGMGTVWKVRDRMVGETVALKTLHVSHDNERAIERFRREVRLARRITSPHVARTHDLGTHSGLHYLTMELVDGASLARVLEQESTLTPERAARVAAQIADGLVAAHVAGVVHRDLKPDNILIEARTARVVVTDFGIARALQDSSDAAKTGGVVGTPLYMAPEQVAGSPVDARADLYALGLVLYEMLTGCAAFEADTPIASAVKRLHQAPPDPRTIVAHVPEGLAQIVLRCLSRDPAGRFPDAATLSRVLHGFAGTGSLSIDLASVAMQGAAMQGALGMSTPSAASTPGSSTPSGASRAPVAPLLKNDRSLAVLPFAYRGPSDQDWLSGGIRDELIDVLSRTRGLRVLGRGAVESLDVARDPRALGGTLGVDLVVDGSVQVGGPRLRVTARLVEVATGTQLWSERFDAEIEDLFVVQERMGHRIAEALRLGMHAVAGAVPLRPETLELYLRARRTARGGNLGAEPEGVVAMLERVIESAPEFQPAYAAHAMACVRAWFVPRVAMTRDWKAVAEASVARALERAPDLAESHFARAQLMSQQGLYREAVQSARTALGIAPTLPEAHMFLASLQLEAGRAKEGLQRLELVLGLEPTLPLAMIEKARWHGLYGELEVFESIMCQWEQDPSYDWMRANQMIRVGAFRGDHDKIERGVELMSRLDNPAAPYLVLYGRTMLGELDAASGVDPVLQVLKGPVSGRFRSLIHQMASEGWGKAGDVEKTLEHFREGADTILLDLEWVDRCPMLAIIRTHPEFPALRRKVRSRCEQIWSA